MKSHVQETHRLENGRYMARSTLAGADMTWPDDGNGGQLARMMFRTGRDERRRLDRAARGQEAEEPLKPVTYMVDGADVADVEEEEDEKEDGGEPKPEREPAPRVDERSETQRWWEDPVPYGDSCPGTMETNLNIDLDGNVNSGNRMRPCAWHG